MNLSVRIKKCPEWKYLLDMMDFYSSWGGGGSVAPTIPPYDPPPSVPNQIFALKGGGVGHSMIWRQMVKSRCFLTDDHLYLRHVARRLRSPQNCSVPKSFPPLPSPRTPSSLLLRNFEEASGLGSRSVEQPLCSKNATQRVNSTHCGSSNSRELVPDKRHFSEFLVRTAAESHVRLLQGRNRWRYQEDARGNSG